MKRPREITINPVLNGFVVKVGCQHVVFTSVKDISLALDAYLRDPEGYEKEFVKNSIYRDSVLLNPQTQTEANVERAYGVPQAATGIAGLR